MRCGQELARSTLNDINAFIGESLVEALFLYGADRAGKTEIEGKYQINEKSVQKT